jgi:hypothetical protein
MSSVQNNESLELPDLHQGTMDDSVLRQYLAELAQSTSELVVTVKDAPRAKFRTIDSLEDLGPLLLQRTVWGAQIFYRLGVERWVDTLLIRGDEFHLVRMSPILQR